MVKMRRLSAVLLACCLGSGLAVGSARAGDVDVATYNQYFGADLQPLVAADGAHFNDALLAVLRQMAANRFTARAAAQARQIAGAAPDLVGLQEVWDLRCRDLPPVAGACADPSIRGAFLDQLDVTLAALRARGATYGVAARVKNFDTSELSITLPGLGTVHGLPFTIGGKNGLVMVKDRDVILRRRGVTTAPVAFQGCKRLGDGCNYTAELKVPIAAFPGLEVVFKRGFVGVDAVVDGRKVRFVTTHLEVDQPQPGNPASMYFQAAQAAELIGTLAATPLPVGSRTVLVGDMNSSPRDVSPGPGIEPPYQQFAAAGYLDAWKARSRSPGSTCCQDEDLSNVPSKLDSRIDFVLVVNPPALVKAADRLGEVLEDRTPWAPGRPRLWPSDHAGVTARLAF